MHPHIQTEIVLRATKGDRKARGELYDLFHLRIEIFCRRLMQSREDAEDVVQVAFDKAFESLTSLRDPGQFGSWLFTIARNEAYGRLRSVKSHETISLDTDVWETVTPFDLCVADETRNAVGVAMEMLKVEYKEVLLLRHFEALSYAEIAGITGDSISAVESRLFKARKALAGLLKQYGPEEI
jgi:RNA polymerase sigma-70 factor, ECF subfamily